MMDSNDAANARRAENGPTEMATTRLSSAFTTPRMLFKQHSSAAC